MATRTCHIRGRVDLPGGRLTHGRCQMCASYWRRHGVERPPGPPREVLPPRRCGHCGQLTMRLKRGRCRRCYAYWLRYGRERPTHLWQRQG